MDYSVIRLGVEWAERYKSIRLQSLAERPQSFSMTYAEQMAWEDKDYIDHFTNKMCFGVVHGDELVAIATMNLFGYASMQHKAMISGVYVDPAHRARGLAKMLLSHILHVAKEAGYTHMQLSVESGNPIASALYTSLGFRQFGYEEASICLDGVTYDDIWMVKHVQEDL